MYLISYLIKYFKKHEKKIVKERIQPLVNLQLEFIDTPDALVRISFNPDGGSWSLLGIDCIDTPAKDATMNLGWFDVATTMHEFGHMLGMIHEHQNPFSNPIAWNKPKVIAWAQETQGWSADVTETNILNAHSSGINGSEFDPLSIMLYFFPAELTTNNQGTHQNLTLSGLDVTWIVKTYPGENSEILPEKFYKDVYNKNIQANIKKSISEAHPRSNTLKYALILLSILIFVFSIVWFLKRKKV